MLDIKEYLKQTKTVLLTQDAFDELMQMAYAQPKRTAKRTETHACDLISRAAAIDAIHEDADWLASQGSNCQVERMERDKSILRSLPSAQPSSSCGHEKDAQSVWKRGKWRHYEGYLICSECRTEYDDDIMTHCCDDVPKFCPNCGADMRGVDDGSD